MASPRRTEIRLPAYGRPVWIRWILTTLFGAVPIGALLGLLFGDPSNGEFDTALAWGSTRQLLEQLGIGVWLCVITWTAIYFEQVNARLRTATAERGRIWLAVTALVLSIVLLGPIALVVAYLAWRRIARAGVRFARGAATTAVAAFAGAAGTVVWILDSPF